MWQLDGQWCMTSDQLRPDAGIAAPLRSVACPVKLIRSPTAQVTEAAGASITGVGRFGSTLIVVVAEPVRFVGSVTRRPTVTSPAVV